MASIYDPQGPQVALGGPSVSPGFAPVQVYDPTRQMLQAVEQQAQLKDRDVEQLAAFSQSLGKFIQERGEEWKKAQIAKGFSAFLNGQGRLPTPQEQQTFKQNEAELKNAAKTDNQLADAAETLPQNAGLAAGIRTNSPALRGWQAYGFSIAQAQNAPYSLANYINNARSSNAEIRDPVSGETFKLSPRMGRAQAERAVEILTEQWSQETGISRINPQVLMEYAGNNLAIAKIRLMEDWGKELDENAKAAQKDIAFTESVRALGGITDPGSAATASRALENILAPYSYQEVNEQFPKILESALQEKLNAGDQVGALSLLNHLGSTPHPSGVGTYRDRNLTAFQSLEAKVQEAGAAQAKAQQEDQLKLFQQEAQVYERLGQAERDAYLNNPTTGLLTRMRLAGMPEEEINKIRTGGSTPFEIQLLTGLRNGTLLSGSGRLTKPILDAYLQNGSIDQSVYDQALGIAKPYFDQQKTVEDVYNAAKNQAEQFVISEMSKSFTGSVVPSEAQKAQMKASREGAMALAMSKLAQSIQGKLDANQPINIAQVSKDLAALTRQELNNPSSTYRWDPIQKTAPNISKATDRPSGGVGQTNFVTTIPPNVLDATTRRVTSIAAPVIAPGSVDLTPESISDAQLAVNQGGKIPQSIRLMAKALGYKDVNRYLTEQATKNGMTWTANPDQQKFIQDAQRISPRIANLLRGELPDSERRRLTRELETLRTQQQTRAAVQTQATPGGTYAQFQADLVQREAGSANPYGQYNFGTARSGPPDPNLTNLRVRDVIRGDYTINGQRVVHFGAYQFKASTFAAVAKKIGLPMDAPFDKQTQDRAFQAVVMEGALPWRTNLNDYMSGKVPDTSANRAAAIQDLRSEWTSMDNVTVTKLSNYIQGMRREKLQPTQNQNLINLPPSKRTVEVGRMILNMGGKIWQHPNFDLNRGYVEGGARVGRHAQGSRHYSSSALDLPLSHNSPTKLDELYDYLRSNAKALGVTQLYWDRKGYYQDGSQIGGPRSNAIPGHDTHLHVAF